MSATPNLAGFQWFLVNVAGISAGDLPPTTPVVAFAFDVALGVVNPALALVGIPNSSTFSYTRSQFDLAVYNLATDLVVNYAVDSPNAPVVTTRPDGTKLTYFDALRFKYGAGAFQAGVVNSVSDVSTSTSLEVIEAMKDLTLGQLQNLKTPWGRNYLAIAQSYGPLWGLT